MAYSIRIRRKTGIWQTEPAIRRGSPPKLDDEIEVNLRGETVKARVNAITTNPSKAKGDPALEVHTDDRSGEAVPYPLGWEGNGAVGCWS
jgi:ribosomal 50S subunit-recycling heat shock protein